jgi:flagellar biogenesis protein FliO
VQGGDREVAWIVVTVVVTLLVLVIAIAIIIIFVIRKLDRRSGNCNHSFREAIFVPEQSFYQGQS